MPTTVFELGPEMRIERYTPRWHDQVIELADRVFGEGYFRRPSALAQEPGSLILIATESDSELYGFAQGRHLPEGRLSAFLDDVDLEIPDDIQKADAAGSLGIIQTVAVSEEQRRRGLGTKLLLAMHDTLVGEGADKLTVTFKRGPSAEKVGTVMQKLDFSFWQSVPAYWRARCDRGEFKCIDRDDHCGCEALLYRKSVY